MTIDENKLEILRKVENGTLTIEEGSDLIAILERNKDNETENEVIDPILPAQQKENPAGSGFWKAAWSMILVAGALLLGFSIYWMVMGYHASGLGWGFWLSWIPLIIGAALIILGIALLDSPWMHVRVYSRDENHRTNLDIDIPVPFNLARWGISNFGQYMPKEVQSDEILEILNHAEESIKNGEPYQVQVDDKECGSKVDVFIN